MQEFYAGLQKDWVFTPTEGEAKTASWVRHHSKHEREQLLIDAAAEGKGWLVEYLLLGARKEGVEPVDINALSEEKCTALMEAASNGHAKIAKFLIGMGASVNVENVFKDTAATLAVEHGHIDALKVLVDANADLARLNRRTGETLVSRAAGFGYDEVVDFLASRIDLSIKSAFNDTAADVARKSGFPDLAKKIEAKMKGPRP